MALKECTIRPLGGVEGKVQRATGVTPWKGCSTAGCEGEADLGRERCEACYAGRGPVTRARVVPSPPAPFRTDEDEAFRFAVTEFLNAADIGPRELAEEAHLDVDMVVRVVAGAVVPTEEQEDALVDAMNRLTEE